MVCLSVCVCRFYTRWKEWESWYSQSFGLHFSLREEQWQEDWAFILSLASQVRAHERKHRLKWRRGAWCAVKCDTLMMYELCKKKLHWAYHTILNLWCRLKVHRGCPQHFSASLCSVWPQRRSIWVGCYYTRVGKRSNCVFRALTPGSKLR